MLQSFFNGLSGMFSFAKGLDNVSNNVANMNTPGFRGSDSFLRNVGTNGDGGYGTSMQGTSTRLSAGEIRQTGNATDLAINGTGFFVVKNDKGDLFYTRAGQFSFNEDGVLIDSATEMEVLGISEGSNLNSINIEDAKSKAAEATSTISLAGALSSADTTHTIENVTVFDSTGQSHNLKLVFTKPDTTSKTWTFEIFEDDDETVLGTGQVGFGSTDVLLIGLNESEVELSFDGISQTVNFYFGEAGSVSNTTGAGIDENSTLGIREADGHGALGLSSVKFDEEGNIEYTYSNGDTELGPQLAIASFSDESKLHLISGSLFRANENMNPTYGQADNLGLGAIVGGSIELSNIDLTQEFADILIIQRGYQASSQVMSVSNELIEQFYSSTRG